VSDLLQTAAEVLGTPAPLVQRSAAARAAANGTTADDILAAWAGGAAVATATAPAAETVVETTAEPVTATEAPPPVVEAPAPPAFPAPQPEPAHVAPPATELEPVELEPAPLGKRVRTAVRVGAWTGAGLGLVGFLVAGAFWAPSTGIEPEGTPFVLVRPTMVLIGVALVSVLFGAVVAALSRAAASWRDPAMQLSSSRSTTGWIGAGLGLILGVAAASLLTGTFGTPIEGSEEALVQLPVLATLGVMLVGGAALGAITSAVPQVVAVPVATGEDAEEVTAVRRRLGNAISIPLAGFLLLAVLVLPFAFALIQSNHMAPNAAAVIAIITAGGILGFASLAGTKPNIRITFGELMVAVIGIGTVVLIILAVLVFRSAESEEEHTGSAPAVVSLV
jgi:hypothetical protein